MVNVVGDGSKNAGAIIAIFCWNPVDNS